METGKTMVTKQASEFADLQNLTGREGGQTSDEVNKPAGVMTKKRAKLPMTPSEPDNAAQKRRNLRQVGHAVAVKQRRVDPARCRIQAGHDRDYSRMSEATCADLLDSIRPPGEQQVAAIVRPVTDEPGIDFEVVCGARRHWTVSHLRRQEGRDVLFLVEIRDLTDEQAFRTADSENRHRVDISDYERSVSYNHALVRHYQGVQRRMAEALQMTNSTLSRYLDFVSLPEPVLDAFGDRNALLLSHVARLAPALRKGTSGREVLARAEMLGAEQAQRRSMGAKPLSGAEVMRQLMPTTQLPREQVRTFEQRDTQGAIIAVGSCDAAETIIMTIPKAGQRSVAMVLAAITEMLPKLMDGDKSSLPRSDAIT